MRTVAPDMEMGSGRLLAVCVEEASCEPKIDNIPPGAKACWKEAALDIPEITGAATALGLERVTLTVTEAVTVFEEPEYVAVMVPGPSGNCTPCTTRVAVAVPAEPTSGADP